MTMKALLLLLVLSTMAPAQEKGPAKTDSKIDTSEFRRLLQQRRDRDELAPAQEKEPLARGLLAGSVRDGRYRIDTTFGVEQLHDDDKTKVLDFRYQIWHLTCNNPPFRSERLPDNTDCRLERIVMDQRLFGGRPESRIIQVDNHHVSDGTLKIIDANFAIGKLDFQLVFSDGSTAEVQMRLKKEDTSLYLKSFKAIGIARGSLSDSLSAVEYRIPPYTYRINIPVEMTGLRSESDKANDDFKSSLSSADRAILAKERDSPDPLPDMEGLKKLIPDIDRINKGERKMTAQEAEKFADYLFVTLLDWIPRSGMSPDGQVKTRAFFTSTKATLIQEMLK